MSHKRRIWSQKNQHKLDIPHILPLVPPISHSSHVGRYGVRPDPSGTLADNIKNRDISAQLKKTTISGACWVPDEDSNRMIYAQRNLPGKKNDRGFCLFCTLAKRSSNGFSNSIRMHSLVRVLTFG